ncbi:MULTISPECIES: cyclase family protein [Dictyoglomus]|uniref:Kynurenine formamidase n=1 Tax=Dictyoglomus turgidum (strain DSM 6724 / Z-1310) TaxID=515635 RepID=B8E178_DICTD|nr:MULTISPECIES: cyclase family protein [Dictyoglomus]ACK42206.1 cyclase family protein [Dictyoglomus turgidum DSM 6724]PNV79860.1 MAG: cyclase family protein [Dictyoglomus turgidum]HBU32436.1 cyclase family protein [Dictyoglomus sp.]
MKIFWDKPIDVSLLIHEDMLFWPNDPKFQREWVAKISEGKNANLSKITLGSHTGTHIDTPYHFLDHGKTLENIDISRFYGFAKVFEIKNPNKILLQDIETLPIEEGDIILFKTKNSLLLKENIFHDDYVGLSLEAARYLADKNVKTIGIDYLSIGPRGDEGREVHRILLGKEIGIIEGLNLLEIKEGRYFMMALPLKIKGGEGSPVRAILFPIEE